MNREHFIHSYQSLKFQETDKNVFNNAIIKRKCLALNFFGSVQNGEDNATTCALLQDDLKEYSKIVDDQEPGSVNNYADYILSSIAQCQNENKKQWKTSLQVSDLNEFLKPLACNKDINELSCKSLKITEDQVKEFKINFNRKIEDLFPKTEEKNEWSEIFEETTDDLLREMPVIPVQVERPREIQTKPTYVSTYERPREMPTKPAHIERPKEFSIRPIILRRNAPGKPTEDSFQPRAGPSFTPDVIEDSKPKPGFFKTARDQLQIDNKKKYGNSGNNMNEPNYNYGCAKKSLGTRKGGVFNKFTPPVRKEEIEPSNTKSNDPEEILDERLKNIDPKMIELIKNEIMDLKTSTTWDDIAGLELAKSTIQEIVVWPMLRPDIFTGLRRPPKGILLFGPPGTGKTLIGKCIASQSNSTFFSISASSLTSKWIGDGEKMVRALFAVAKVHQPAVVFIDEIDSLLSQRSDTEHESSRRLKTEFLVQLDGAGTGDEDRILIIGATNRPQELDEAARRRLVKRLYIPLPDERARKEMIRKLLSGDIRHCLSESEIEEIAKLTEGYSGADVRNLCQEASLGPIRSIPPHLMQNIDPEQVRPLNASDFKSALARIKSSVSEKDLDTYIAWDRQFGCGSVH